MWRTIARVYVWPVLILVGSALLLTGAFHLQEEAEHSCGQKRCSPGREPRMMGTSEFKQACLCVELAR